MTHTTLVKFPGTRYQLTWSVPPSTEVFYGPLFEDQASALVAKDRVDEGLCATVAARDGKAFLTTQGIPDFPEAS